ncbi:hypothetical protein FJY94_09235 [Candidatus Kaiserbacteria bacterium]|nr:hypothetical protein [Candidatus Kaiserbacteria bacterium]
MPIARCPACATAFEAKPELASRRVRCPKCKQPFQVSESSEEDRRSAAAPASVSWLIFGAAVVISVAVGGAVGFVVGHEHGKADDVGELNEAKSRAEGALQRQKTLESELASAVAERDREKDRLETALKEREQQIATTQEAASRAAAQAKASKDKLDALIGEESAWRGGRRRASQSSC